MKTLGLVTGIVLLVMLMPSVLATSNITSCNQASLAGDIYLIQNDINMDLDNWCWFVGNDTVVDCQGYTLNCNGSYWFGQTGNIVNNVTLKNCVVNYSNDGDVDLSQGLWFGGTGYNMLFENITLEEPYPVGSSFGYGLVAMNGNYAYGDSENITIRDISTTGQVNISGGEIVSFLNARNITIENFDFNVSGSGGRGFDCNNCSGTITDINGYTDDVGVAVYDNSSVNITNAILTSGYQNALCFGNNCYIEINGLIGSSTNDGITLYSGTSGNLNNITLDGQNGTTNIGININGANVTVDDFEIYNYSRGIFLYNSDGYSEIKNGLIYDINVSGNSGHSFLIYNYNNTLIENVDINNTYGGIVYVGIGKQTENHILKNVTESYAGLSGVSGSSVVFIGANNVTVSECNFGYNAFWDIYLDDYFYGIGNDNILLYNNTFDITNGAYINTTGTASFNDSSYGNNWSDYSGCDLDSDGIGETPYLVNSSASTYDYLPLTSTPCAVPAITVVIPDILSAMFYPNMSSNTQPYYMNITTDFGVKNCTWMSQGSANYTMSNSSNTSWYGSILPSASQGNFNIEFYCESFDGTVGYNDTIYLIYDWTPPTLTMIDPQNISYAYNTTIDVNVTFTDSYSPVLNWSIDIDSLGIQNVGLATDLGGSLTNVSSGLHHFNVSGVDNAGNENYTEIWFTVLGTSPPSVPVFQQYPILATIPIVLIGALLTGLFGSILLSGTINLKHLITAVVAIMVAIVIIGVMYAV